MHQNFLGRSFALSCFVAFCLQSSPCFFRGESGVVCAYESLLPSAAAAAIVLLLTVLCRCSSLVALPLHPSQPPSRPSSRIPTVARLKMPSAKSQLLLFFFALVCALAQLSHAAADAGDVIAGLVGTCASLTHCTHAALRLRASERRGRSCMRERARRARAAVAAGALSLPQSRMRSRQSTRLPLLRRPIRRHALLTRLSLLLFPLRSPVLGLVFVCAFLGWWSRRGDTSRSSGSEGETA